jgi:hypothetical protein
MQRAARVLVLVLVLWAGLGAGMVWAAVLATDNFNRANGAIGANWTQAFMSNMNVIANAAGPANIAFNAAWFYSATTFPNDHYAQAKMFVTGGTGAQGVGLLVRASVDNAYYLLLTHEASNNVWLYKRVAGVTTNLTFRTQAWTEGDTARLEVQGTAITIKINGVAVGAAVTDTALTTGSPGLMYIGGAVTAASMDDFEGGDFTVAGVSRKRPLWFNFVPWLGAKGWWYAQGSPSSPPHAGTAAQRQPVSRAGH